MWVIAWINNFYERSLHLNNNQMHFHCAERRHEARALSARITFVKCIIRLNMKRDLQRPANECSARRVVYNCENICETRERTMPAMTQLVNSVIVSVVKINHKQHRLFLNCDQRSCWRNCSLEWLNSLHPDSFKEE